jgi:hypothetical protein
MADVLVDRGRQMLADRLKGTGTEPAYAHWGIGTTAAAVTDTALQTPGTEARVLGTSTIVTTDTTSDTYQLVTTITCNATAKAITEYGQFDAITAGNMLIRSVFAAINVVQNDAIQFTSKLDID